MAVYKNSYTRNSRKWVVTFNCLYLVCISSTISGTLASAGERLRHHHPQQQQIQQQQLYSSHHHRQQQSSASATATIKNHQPDFYTFSQLEKTNIEDTTSSKLPGASSLSSSSSSLSSSISSLCPNCLFKKNYKDYNYNNRQYQHQQQQQQQRRITSTSTTEQDNLRLEAIKRQILSKLGLRHKPNVTHSLPREVIMQTLFRAEDNSDFFRNFDSDDDNISTTSTRTTSTVMETVDVDDFYGRTSEIISFAEQGSRVNQNRLLEFRISTTTSESGQQATGGQEFRIRSAALWLKADVKHRRSPHQCRTTEIYVFKIISRLPESVTLSSQDFDRATSDPVTIPLQESNSGWQKLDLTDIVKKWFLEESRKEKLRLFVDCSCCSNWYIHLFNDYDDNNNSNNNKHINQQQQQQQYHQNRPFLVIHTDPNTAKRVRRRALDCSPDSGNQCCKERFYVSFKQLGWDDWVIAPQGYFANYCRGDCGHHRTPDTYVTYHTHVIEEVRKTHHLSGMQPCCAPLKFSSMSLIYYGAEETIIKRDLPKMVVDECGCP